MKKLQLRYIDTDAFVLSIITKDKIRGLKNLEHKVEFSKNNFIFDLDEKHKFFSIKNKRSLLNLKLKLLKLFGLMNLFVWE